ncbi:MAG: carbonic anhydrase [Oscillospiraceae bacterium]|nr:carbonic anhydrase [Oscillospiraceae bacterium]MBR7010002.1 carbonic anhydrase [Oscillospiraceae bacterium]
MEHSYSDVLACGGQLAMGEELPFCPEAEASLRCLMRGNAQYLERSHNPTELTDHIRLTTAHEGQHPYAAVLCCADSRVPPEHIFSAGIGDLFVIRNAGNVMSPTALGSLEYAAAHLHVSLILIMAHRGCGAVVAALQKHPEHGALGELIAEVRVGVGHAHDPRQAERNNLLHSLEALGESEVLRDLADRGKLAFAGAVYDIRSGAVELLLPEGSAE